ncbi:MAG: hypothetical protein L0177_01285 [Chloroflexi bacterium]|nr:hypothetical protein [Chloroflexota bacterium]
MDKPQPTFRDALAAYEGAVRAEFVRLLRVHFGDNWWELGVLAALNEIQAESLRKRVSRENRSVSEDLLEISHFLPVFRSNYRTVFLQVFPEYLRTCNILRGIRDTRNRWAHLEKITDADIEQCFRQMIELLGDAGLSAAADVRQMQLRLSSGPGGLVVEQPAVSRPKEMYQPAQGDSQDLRVAPTPTGGEMDKENVQRSELIDETDSNDEPEVSLELTSWRKFLSRRVEVEAFTNERGRSRRKVRVHITNIAPASPDAPEVRFKDVSLTVKGISSSQSQSVGRLEPSQSVTREFEVDPEELLSLEFSVRATLDYEAFFRTISVVGIPDAEVQELASSCLRDLRLMNLQRILNECDTILQSLTPDTTLAEVRRIREALIQIASQTHQQREQLQGIFSRYRLMKGSTLGDHIVGAVRLVESLRSALEKVDEAIASSEPDAIETAVNGVRQLTTEAIRFENATRRIEERFGISPTQPNVG